MKTNTFSRKLTALAVSSVVGAIAFPQLSVAQSSGFAIEEVVVTARKREESLQDTPISVSAFSGDSLELRQVDTSDRLGQVTPNLTFDANAPSSGHSSASQVFIRGIGQTDFLPTTDPGVGIYVDGVYYARSIGSAFDFFDVERIEVLRGPQGTLFGRNTIGGAISIITKKPTDEAGGEASLKVGSDELVEAKLSVNGALSDGLFGNFTAATKQRDGYVTRLQPGTGEDLGDDDVISFRGALVWDATDTLQFHLAADYTEEDENGAPLVFGDLRITPPGVEGPGLPVGPVFAALQNSCGGLSFSLPPDVPGALAAIGDTSDPRCPNSQFAAGPFANNGTGPVSSTLEAWGLSLTTEWQANDWLTVKSITGYREIDAFSERDADNTPLTILDTNNRDVHEQFSQEIQFIGSHERLNWVAGVYYFEEQDDNDQIIDTATGSLQLDGDIDNDNIAVFGQVTYDISDLLSLTVGLRWTEETKRYQPNQRPVVGTVTFPGFAIPNPGTCPDLTNTAGPLCLIPIGQDLVLDSSEQEQTFSETTPMVSLSYQVTGDALVYATYSEGFKSGGFNARNVGIFPSLQTFDPEFADTFEIGLKSSWLDNTLQLNGAVFFTDYTDLQFVVRQGIAPLLFNAGEASINGLELEATWVPTQNWLITGGLGYVDAEYDEVAAGSGVSVDNDLAQTPELSVNLGIAYTVDLNNWILTPRIDWTFTDDRYFDAVNSPQLLQESYDIVNATISLDSADDRWNVALAVSNLTDEEYLAAGTSAFTTGLAYVEHVFAREREFSLSVKYRW